MSIIYETSGRAREYFELAANLYGGCEHACLYCYGADVLHKNPKEYFKRGVPKSDVLEILERDAARLSRKNEIRHILLSFVTDPYQPAEMEFRLTRRAIEILHKNGLAVAILTKGGFRAMHDFDLLTKADCFGVTLTFLDANRSREWEPGAAVPIERAETLKHAKARGIPTWVSLEPVIDPAETLTLIATTASYVDVFKVGTLNYINKLPPELKRQVKGINWKKFAQDAIKLLDSLGVNYYIKRDLAKHIGRPEGITKGNVPK